MAISFGRLKTNYIQMKIRWIRELFSFSRKERTGIVILLLIIFILIIVGKLIPYFIHSDKPNFSKWEAEVDAYLAQTEKKNDVAAEFHPVVFNPNEVDSVTLINIGIPPKVVVNWMRYLDKGGRFTDNEGVKKIFGMTPELFEKLDSFMLVPRVKLPVATTEDHVNRTKPQDRHNRDTFIQRPFLIKREKKDAKVLELNSTDSLRLLEIPGIGPVFASRIIRYRNLLGGYYSVGQLREVYGMRDENFVAVSQYFTADSSKIKTFNINFSTIQEIGRHPYFGFRTARKILKLRDKMGKFSSPDDLSPVIAGDSLKRLIPYIKFM
jgi:competence protein ComEA